MVVWCLVYVYITRRCVNVLISFLVSPNYYIPLYELNNSLGYIKRVYVYITRRCVHVLIGFLASPNCYIPLCELNNSLGYINVYMCT